MDEYRLAPLQDNAVIYLSPEDPPTEGQSILSRKQNAIMTVETDTAITSMFHRMKASSTERADDSFNAIRMTLSEGDQKTYDVWWKRLKSLTTRLKTSIDQNHSLIATADGAEGADLLIVWRQDDNNDDDDDFKEVIHIAA
jgi:hypothetical protein